MGAKLKSTSTMTGVTVSDLAANVRAGVESSWRDAKDDSAVACDLQDSRRKLSIPRRMWIIAGCCVLAWLPLILGYLLLQP